MTGELKRLCEMAYDAECNRRALSHNPERSAYWFGRFVSYTECRELLGAEIFINGDRVYCRYSDNLGKTVKKVGDIYD